MTLVESFKSILPCSKKELFDFLQDMDKKIDAFSSIDLVRYKKEFVDFYNYFSKDFLEKNPEYIDAIENELDVMPNVILLGQHYIETDEMVNADIKYFSLDEENQMYVDILLDYIVDQNYNVIIYYVQEDSDAKIQTYFNEDLDRFMNQKIIRGNIAELLRKNGILLLKCYEYEFCGKCINYGFLISNNGIGIIDAASLQNLLKNLPVMNKEENIYATAEL